MGSSTVPTDAPHRDWKGRAAVDAAVPGLRAMARDSLLPRQQTELLRIVVKSMVLKSGAL